MRHLTLTLSLILGLGTYASASDNAAQILSGGKILKEYSKRLGFDPDRRRDVFILTYLVAHKKGLFECVVREVMEQVQCVQLSDLGVIKK